MASSGHEHYLLYVLHGPDGGLIAHRFDVVDEVRLRPGRVEYLDLALDVWVDPLGRAWTEDEDEVAELASQAPLSSQRLALIERTSGCSWRVTGASRPRRKRSYGGWAKLRKTRGNAVATPRGRRTVSTSVKVPCL